MSTACDSHLELAKLGALACLPQEIRHEIYDHMCAIDASVYDFVIEGPNDIHVPATTVHEILNPKVPLIAQVCTYMRDYVLSPASLQPIIFTYYRFCTAIMSQPNLPVELV